MTSAPLGRLAVVSKGKGNGKQQGGVRVWQPIPSRPTMSGKHGYNAMSPSYGKRLPIQAYDGRFRTYSLASLNDTGAAMKTPKRLSLLLDLLLLAASLAGGGPIV